MIKYLFLLLLTSTAQANDKWSFEPSVAVGVGFSVTLIDSPKEPVYGLIQAFTINFGGDEGGLRFLGIGTTIGSDPEVVFIPGSACIMDTYCFAPHLAKNYVGAGFTYSFGGPKNK